MVFSTADPKTQHLLKPIKEGLGYTLSLDNYRDIDGLDIETSVTYVVPMDGAFSWTMPFASDGLSGEIHFPKDLQIHIDPFVMESTAFHYWPGKTENGLEVCKYEYPTWLLPGDGFAFHFRKTNQSPGPGKRGKQK